MKKLCIVICVFGCIGLMSQCEKENFVQVFTQDNEAFIARWDSTNCGTQPNGDLYRWNQLPTCRSGYRVPTKDEYNQLLSCPFVWGNKNGTPGWFFYPSEAEQSKGDKGKRVFFPANGGRTVYQNGSADTYQQGETALYWTSTPYESDPDKAYLMLIFSTFQDVTYAYWRYPMGDGVWMFERNVRCIKE